MIVSDCYNIYSDLNNLNRLFKKKKSGRVIDIKKIKLLNSKTIIVDEVFVFEQEEEAYACIDEENDLIECLHNLHSLHIMINPISMQKIPNHQVQSAPLLALVQNNPI